MVNKELRLKKLILAILLVLLIPADGCRHNVSNNPKVVFAATILDAATAVDDFSIALRAADDGVTQLRPSEPEYYNAVHPYLVNLARLNDKAILTIRAAKAGDTSANWKQAVADIAIAAGKTDPTVFGFKNPSSQATAKILFASFSTAIQAISASFGGK